MKALVTGGAGFIGSNLVGRLVNEGREVVVLDNFDTGARGNLKGIGDVKVVEGEVENLGSLEIGKVEEIYHLGMPSSSPMYRKNPYLVGKAINGHIAVLELAKKLGVGHVVYASTSSLYNGVKPPHREDAEIRVTDYYSEVRVAMERISELYEKMHGVKSAGMRFFSVYGPMEKAKGKYANVLSQFLWEMKEGKRPVIYGDGGQERDFTHVSDVVEACILASEKKAHGVFNVGTGKSASFNEVVGMLNKALGTSIEPKYRKNPIKNYVEITRADTRKSKGELGFSAKVSLEEGIRLLI